MLCIGSTRPDLSGRTKVARSVSHRRLSLSLLRSWCLGLLLFRIALQYLEYFNMNFGIVNWFFEIFPFLCRGGSCPSPKPPLPRIARWGRWPSDSEVGRGRTALPPQSLRDSSPMLTHRGAFGSRPTEKCPPESGWAFSFSNIRLQESSWFCAFSSASFHQARTVPNR